MDCKELIISKLSHLPSEWRCQIADVICNYVKTSYSSLLCSDFKACETITSLSAFSVDGNEVCISFKDEEGVTVERCFNYTSIINNWLNQLDPNCLGTRSEWVAMTHDEKIQSMIDQICESCSDDATTTTTTTTTSTTTTTTLAPCTSYSIENTNEEEEIIEYVNCDGEDIGISIAPLEMIYLCAVENSIASNDGVEVNIIGSCAGNTTTTSTTTTTTGVPTTTTTTTTSTTTTTTFICEATRFVNETGSDKTIHWTSCDGGNYGATILDGQTLVYCTQPGTATADSGVVITDLGDC